ncbi:hypothetical protein T440DRAFT_552139 [Plenodomus tracheiphilus IPT5]|uniref:Myb-like domain-containing protein n=1 Tax=Plenodomus tracheiphilus IPT5 TaxID=1408161 RepID=A0A6A7BFQ9_9PLEO|nr:hypothetical protein T440DRAFT_552139 [Plenodomus tracheiphilus IPT5]
MSAEDTAAAPPPASDKAQAPKAAATFSSFINKNTTGKKFAPKAARRRPGAAPPAATPAPSAPEPAPAASEPVPAAPEPTPEAPAQDFQPHTARPVPAPASEPDVSHAPAQISAVTQLPTPAATQEPIPPSAPVPTPNVPALNRAIDEPAAPPEPPSSAAAPLPPPLPTSAPTARGKRQRPVPTAAQDVPPTPPATRPEPDPSQPAEEAQVAAAETPSIAPDTAAQVAVAPAAQDDGDTSNQPPSRKRRRLPWVAVNHPRDDEPDEDVAAPPKKTRRKAKAPAIADGDADAEHMDDQDGNEDGAPPSRKRSSAKARGKKKTAVAPTEGELQDEAVPKRVRKPSKTKPVAAENADGVEVTGTRRKPRQPKRRKRDTTEADGEEGEDNAQPKRKGRPPREPTPSDAEDHMIDPDETYMDALASRNIRVGKLSRREREMRKVDWAAVRQRRREEDTRHIESKAEQEAADRALAEAGANLQSQQVEPGARYSLVDGVITVVHDSGTIDRAADADREIAEYEIIEDQDITARITSRSFLKNNKRFPNDFILPGQGRRWNTDSTELFYQGLKSFGTDFQMISQMFPGSTRRSIKTKFTREERENPDRVREALHGQSEIVSHWDVFLEASQLKEESFVDADEIKRQLAAEEADMRKRIEVAKAETEERNRQKAAAGVLDDENGEAGNKENGKGKRKKRDKGKQVAFQDEPGVEIMGTIDDDDTWGQE